MQFDNGNTAVEACVHTAVWRTLVLDTHCVVTDYHFFLAVAGLYITWCISDADDNFVTAILKRVHNLEILSSAALL